MNKPKAIILEKEWEADDIIAYCKSNDILCQVLSQLDIADLSPGDFFACPRFLFHSNISR